MVLAVCVAAGFIGVAADEASASQPAKATNGAGTAVHCYAVLKKLAPGQDESEVVSSGCVNSTARMPALLAEKTKLIQIYEDAGFQSVFDYSLYGNDGPCDTAGYGYHDLSLGAFYGVSWEASSYKTFNRCGWVMGFRERDYQQSNGWQPGDQSYIGDFLNDHLLSLKVRRFP